MKGRVRHGEQKAYENQTKAKGNRNTALSCLESGQVLLLTFRNEKKICISQNS